MMKYYLIAGFVLITFTAGLYVWNGPFRAEKTKSGANPASPSPTILIQPKEIDIQASFQIITGNIIRSFKNSKYHLKSPDVYISPENPAVVHVKKTEKTWGDFFNTLPMKLTKDCLITGDGETLCTGPDGVLKFYLNEKEEPSLLDKKIENGDEALIDFKKSAD